MAPRVTLVGHPFAPIGMGEHLRATFRALRAVGVDALVRDVYGTNERAKHETVAELRSRLVPRLDSDVTIFVLNGDEREQAFRHLDGEIARSGYKIVYPAWELPRYPEPWARELEHYEEVWAASRFSRDSFAASVRRSVHHLPLPCHPIVTRQLSRRYFGLSETAFVFVFFFDLTSYIERKNPHAVVAAFANLRAARPYADVQLVLKVNNKHADLAAYDRLVAAVAPVKRHTVLIDRTLTDNEVRNLVRVGDAFVSLHRSEGFGFGLAEAMYFGKPVIATGYSGNMDFMTPETAFLVRHTLVPVREGSYPHATGQVWAEPDVDEAAAVMIGLTDDPGRGREIGARASAHVRTHFSLRAAGLRYSSRIEEIWASATRARRVAGDVPSSGAAALGFSPAKHPPREVAAEPPRGGGVGAPREALCEELERAARSEGTLRVYEALRQLSLREVGELLLDVPPGCSALRDALPTMPPDHVQVSWTGNSGRALLEQSLAFVEETAAVYESLTGRRLDGATILDYGCGWGRLIRLMYKFSSPDRIYGCDAWASSLHLCREYGVRAHLSLCEEVPREVPFGDVKFDLIYAFSLFTHLSEGTAKAVITALRPRIAPDGLLAITIRPPEYWDAHPQEQSPADVARMKREHTTRGFAFTPHDRRAVRGDLTYGDASISIDYIQHHWPGWSVARHGISAADPLQQRVFLRPA